MGNSEIGYNRCEYTESTFLRGRLMESSPSKIVQICRKCEKAYFRIPPCITSEETIFHITVANTSKECHSSISKQHGNSLSCIQTIGQTNLLNAIDGVEHNLG